MTSLAMRRAKQHYHASLHVPHDGGGQRRVRAGNFVVWVVGLGVVLFVASYWMLVTMFGR